MALLTHGTARQALGPSMQNTSADGVFAFRLHSSPFRREECEQYVRSVWDWLEGLGTGVSRADPSTWVLPTWPPSYRGVINTLEARTCAQCSVCYTSG